MIADHPAISRITGQRIGRLLRFDRLVFFVAGVIACKSGFAQVVLDGKFGTAGPVAGPNYNIASDLGKIHGNNLFQSFSQSSKSSSDIATPKFRKIPMNRWK